MTPQEALEQATPADRFFDGFQEHSLEIDDTRIFYRIAGSGPPLLLLHGYPQTSAMWHAIAPVLAETYTVIAPDLRGYGRSIQPAPSADHAAHSKRAMARDLIALMDHLGFERFLVGAHDRGGRVAHRMAADFPDRVAALSVLDIAPTREMYRDGTSDFAQAYWHWYWLTQSAPFPENLIGANAGYFWLVKCGDGSAGLRPFVRQAMAEYLTCFCDKDAITSSCEDYRAAASIDIAHDDADPSKLAMPLLALWGKDGVIEKHFDCLALWRERATDVRGHALPGGHYLAEESPQALLDVWQPFFTEMQARLG